MTKGLLLGNGINNRIGITELSIADIYERFKLNLRRQSIIFESVFNVKTDCEFERIVNGNSKTIGIELLAGLLYEYIKRETDLQWSMNCEYRLQDIISCLCITSIFYGCNGLIKRNFDADKIPSLEGYDYVYTLNYFEFWDENHCVKNLHGHIDLNKLPDVKNAIIVSNQRLSLSKYKEAINILAKDNVIVEVDTLDIVFAPDGISKNDLVCIAGLHLSNDLFPATDLYPINGKVLYAELREVDSIDILGMSPYGDKALIDEINKKLKTRVFVYDAEHNQEYDDWKKELHNDYELLDSSEI